MAKVRMNDPFVSRTINLHPFLEGVQKSGGDGCSFTVHPTAQTIATIQTTADLNAITLKRWVNFWLSLSHPHWQRGQPLLELPLAALL